MAFFISDQSAHELFIEYSVVVNVLMDFRKMLNSDRSKFAYIFKAAGSRQVLKQGQCVSIERKSIYR